MIPNCFTCAKNVTWQQSQNAAGGTCSVFASQFRIPGSGTSLLIYSVILKVFSNLNNEPGRSSSLHTHHRAQRQLLWISVWLQHSGQPHLPFLTPWGLCTDQTLPVQIYKCFTLVLEQCFPLGSTEAILPIFKSTNIVSFISIAFSSLPRWGVRINPCSLCYSIVSLWLIRVSCC